MRDIYTDIVQLYVTLTPVILLYMDALHDNMHSMETAWELVKMFGNKIRN